MTRFIEDLRKVPVLRVLFPLLIGILVESSCQTGLFPFWLLSAALCMIIAALINRIFKSGILSISPKLIPTALFLLFISIGILHSRWTRQQKSQVIMEGELFVSGVVSSNPEEKEKTFVLAVEVEYFVSRDSIMRGDQLILIYLQKDSLMPEIYPGERWLFRGRVQGIRNNGNPGEFDYAAYMQRKGICSMMFAESASSLKLNPVKGIQLKYLPAKISRRIRSSWDLHNPDLAVLSAITLGDKTMIPHETRDAFAGSGAMHLLAVSGLHVGMIWWILDLLIIFPRRKAVFRILKVILILGILWMYAGITGFSESVSRSVTMFSLISLARVISRNSNIYNTLFLSAFILLVIDPRRIEEPGFQLSYLAVLGIVSIHPILDSMLPASNKILKRVRDLVVVSIAAQLATFPVALLYFHQFPLYFMFTNILAIPLVSILLALFVIFSPFFILDYHADIFLWILEKLSHLLNKVVGLISSLPGAAILDIPMSVSVCLLLIFLIFSLTGFAYYKRVTWLIVSTGLSCCILFFSGALRIPDLSVRELHIYHFRDYTAITSISNKQYCDYVFYHDKPPDRYVDQYLQSRGKMNRQCTDYHLFNINVEEKADSRTGSMAEVCEGAWGMQSGGKKILVCGGCKLHDLNRILELTSWDIVVFRSRFPRLSAVQTDFLDGVTCIADGSLREYELTRIKVQIPGIYSTSERGAWSSVSLVH